MTPENAGATAADVDFHRQMAETLRKKDRDGHSYPKAAAFHEDILEKLEKEKSAE